MIKLILSGCGGAMGHVLAASIAARSDCEAVAGVNPREVPDASFPVYSHFDDCTLSCDGIIDFSHPKNLAPLLAFALKRHFPVVIATTGYTEEQIRKIEESSKEIPIFFSANMSLGVSLMRELCVKATKVLGGQFDIELVEKHHNKKLDAPSGTALMLANAVSEALPFGAKYIYDRHSTRTKRDPQEIGIHSIRGGTIVGEHELIFAGQDEVLTITHSAYSKRVFAEGAINAAKFLIAKQPGLYTMADLVEET